MGRLEITGRFLRYLFWGVSLPGVALLVAQLPLAEHPANAAVVVLFVLLLGASGVAVWRRRTGRYPEHLRKEEGIAWDPIAYPEQAAKERWARSIRRLSDADDEDD